MEDDVRSAYSLFYGFEIPDVALYDFYALFLKICYCGIP